MARSISGFFRVVGTLAILALLGADTFMTLQLRGEVKELESREGSPPVSAHERAVRDDSQGRAESAQSGSPGASTDVPTLLAAAKRHADAARAALEQKDYVTASHEMALSGQAAQRASRAVTAEGEDRLAALKGALGAVQAQTAALQARADALLAGGHGAERAGPTAAAGSAARQAGVQ
jgi:hypothetical protein